MQILGTGEIGSTKRKFHLSGVPVIESRLYCSKNINKIRLKYGRDLILFKKQKEDAPGDLIYLKY